MVPGRGAEPLLEPVANYAKASPDDILTTIEVINAGPDAATLHVLPTAWSRNTWSWEIGAARNRSASDPAGLPGSAARPVQIAHLDGLPAGCVSLRPGSATSARRFR